RLVSRSSHTKIQIASGSGITPMLQVIDATLKNLDDTTKVTGIYRALSVRVGPTQRTAKSLFKTYIDCLHIKKSDKSRMLAEAQTEVENSLGGNSEEILFDEKRVHTFLVPRIDE
ncbi:hypothetical protein ABKV19_004052, partial [Rosa sericea]